MSNFAERLQEQLYEHNMTAEDLEKELSVSNSNIYKWLRNEAIPNLASLIKLSDYFKCTVDFLSGRSHENFFSTPKSVKAFAFQLQALIKTKQISNYAFAKAAKIPRTSLHHWTNGRSEPLLDNLIKLADYLDCTIDYLIGRE